MDRERAHTLVTEFVHNLNQGEEDQVPLSSTFDDLGIDSLSLVDLLFKLEREFAVSIPDEALPGISTVGDLMDYVTTAAR